MPPKTLGTGTWNGEKLINNRKKLKNKQAIVSDRYANPLEC